MTYYVQAKSQNLIGIFKYIHIHSIVVCLKTYMIFPSIGRKLTCCNVLKILYNFGGKRKLKAELRFP